MGPIWQYNRTEKDRVVKVSVNSYIPQLKEYFVKALMMIKGIGECKHWGKIGLILDSVRRPVTRQ